MKVIKYIGAIFGLALIGTYIPFGNFFVTGVFLVGLWKLIND